MNPEEFRAFGHRLVDWIADYRATTAARPVMSQVEPGSIKAKLPAHPPLSPESMDAILADVENVIVPGLSHWQHPRFFGYFPSNGELSSVLGDYLSTGLGVLGLSWQSSPALTEVEEVATDWLRQMVGTVGCVERGHSGHRVDQHARCPHLRARARLRVLAGARRIAGRRGSRSSCTCPRTRTVRSTRPRCSRGSVGSTCGSWTADAAFAMRPEALAARRPRGPCAGPRTVRRRRDHGHHDHDRGRSGRSPSRIAREHGLWLHVDAAMAGSAMILPECRPLWDGIEGADSIVLNPHKWLGVAFDCSVYYVRDAQHLVRVMSTNPSYLRTAVDER
jgi:aromatic-L-amino-acid decarboxylase